MDNNRLTPPFDPRLIGIQWKENPHKFAHFQPRLPLPQVKGSQTGSQTPQSLPPQKHIWYDQTGTRYVFGGKWLGVHTSSNLKTYESLLKHISFIPSDIQIEIPVYDIKSFNQLCVDLQRNPTNKNISIINFITVLPHNRVLKFECLPNNVQVKSVGNQVLDTWALWLDNDAFACVASKLDPKTKNRIIDLRIIALKFYRDYIVGANLSEKEKARRAFNWILKNTKYDWGAIQEDGHLRQDGDFSYTQDALETYKNRKGVCAGRSRLLKVLLNNRFVRIDCFVTEGRHGHLGHEWNEIYFSDGTRLYYDSSYGISEA